MSEKRTRSRKQPVHGQMMDKRAVGKAVHVSVKKLTSYMGNHHCTLEQAHDHFKETEPESTRKALIDLMAILYPA